jgi:hypothetical protein
MTGDFMGLISKMEEEFGCGNDIFGLFGHFRAQGKCVSEVEQSVKDEWTVL